MVSIPENIVQNSGISVSWIKICNDILSSQIEILIESMLSMEILMKFV